MIKVKWVLMTALALAFLMLAVANWTPVPFRLPNGSMVIVQLPVLLAGAFAAGWLPTWLIHLATKTQLKRRLAKACMVTAAEPRPSPLPSQAQPTIVPPAGA
jgi:uncharacterized integral membrane protein